MKRLLYLLPALFVISACTKKVDSEDLKDEVPYYQGYEVSYNKNDNTTTAAAWFTVRNSGGARVELSGNANVRANGMTPGTSSIDKTRYTWTLTGNPDVEFVLTKSSGTKISNTLSTSDIGDMNFTSGFPTSVSRSAGFTFSWMGTALRTDETVHAILKSLTGTTVADKDVTSNSVTFTAADMASCPTGEMAVELYRTRDITLKNSDGTAGGAMQVRMNRSKNLTVNP